MQVGAFLHWVKAASIFYRVYAQVTVTDVSSVSSVMCPSAAQSHQEGPLPEASELLPLLQPLTPRQALPAGLHQPEGQAAASLLQRLY